ncbi:holin [Clostridium phage phiCTP1]|uniref:holin n=1 Tax=Clostridium phage phiCTP1 TaxID=871584 RepID=UPI0001E0782A|nr:holin [Clostridium phage phiCTP1]ADL40329.1 predicted holin [Clostridium phage phiCTP1]
MDKLNIHCLQVGVAGALLTFLFGGWDMSLEILAVFILLDYISGLVKAFTTKTVNSQTGFKGLLKKSEILIILIVATLLDRLINSGDWIFRTLVCYYYIANEGISILENCGKSGLPVPQKLVDALEQLQGIKKNKEENKDEENSRHK